MDTRDEAVREAEGELGPPAAFARAEAVRAYFDVGAYQKVVGLLESGEVDFKREPYRLTDDRQKFELGKDVSALANAHGGIIVLGIDSKPHPRHPTDEATAVVPFPDNLLEEGRMQSIVEDRVFPVMQGVTVTRYAVAANKALAIIAVPAQASSLQPFVVRRFVDADSKKEDGAVFAMYERRNADAKPLSVPEAQALMRDGRNFRAMLDLGVPAFSPQSGPLTRSVGDVEAMHRLAVLRVDTGIAALPSLGLYLEPRPTIDATPMFSSTLSPLTSLLYSPPSVRDSGFELNTGVYPEIHRGESRRALSSEFKGLALWKDGMLGFVERADEQGISWASPSAGGPLQLNPIALVEKVLLFCLLAHEVFRTAGQFPETVRARVEMKNLCREGEKPLLRAKGRGQDAKPYHACDLAFFFDAGGTIAPDALAGQLVTKVYELFGFEHDRVPFVTIGRQGPVVSAQQLASLG